MSSPEGAVETLVRHGLHVSPRRGLETFFRLTRAHARGYLLPRLSALSPAMAVSEQQQLGPRSLVLHEMPDRNVVTRVAPQSIGQDPHLSGRILFLTPALGSYNLAVNHQTSRAAEESRANRRSQRSGIASISRCAVELEP
jgi:hypothetical protein